MANSEDIEARLCAYIEGDLDPQQRQDIERHLDDHPPHRQMIQDLIQTRDLLTALPRAAAPADLGEGLQSQLERSMLLGDDPDAHDPWRAKARRVPRLAAMSFVAILTVGLAGVIVSLLHEASHPVPIVPLLAQTPPIIDPPLALIPATEPATQPAVIAIAVPVAVAAIPTTQPIAEITPATQPTTQPTPPSTTVQLANYSAGPTTEPDDTDMDDGDAPALDPTNQPTPTTAPVADGDDDQ